MFAESARWVARGIEAVGILIIVLGAVSSTAVFLKQLARSRTFAQLGRRAVLDSGG